MYLLASYVHTVSHRQASGELLMVASRTKMMDKGGRDHVGDRQGCRMFLIGWYLTKIGCHVRLLKFVK